MSSSLVMEDDWIVGTMVEGYEREQFCPKLHKQYVVETLCFVNLTYFIFRILSQPICTPLPEMMTLKMMSVQYVDAFSHAL